MTNLRSQIAQLKNDFKKYEDTIEVITLDNGGQLKFKSDELIDLLVETLHSSSSKENSTIKLLKEHKIVNYTGSGSLPQLIVSIIESKEN